MLTNVGISKYWLSASAQMSTHAHRASAGPVISAEHTGHKRGSSLNHLRHRGNTCLECVQNKRVEYFEGLRLIAAVQVTEPWVVGCITCPKFLELILTCIFQRFLLRIVYIKLVWVLFLFGRHAKFQPQSNVPYYLILDSSLIPIIKNENIVCCF